MVSAMFVLAVLILLCTGLTAIAVIKIVSKPANQDDLDFYGMLIFGSAGLILSVALSILAIIQL